MSGSAFDFPLPERPSTSVRSAVLLTVMLSVWVASVIVTFPLVPESTQSACAANANNSEASALSAHFRPVIMSMYLFMNYLLSLF